MEDRYKSGEVLYGDDLNIDQIQKWYDEETEAYADLGSKDAGEYVYGYDALNALHGFSYLKDKKFENALGVGAAWGHEFYPILDQLKNIYIVEPSDNLRSDKIGDIVPQYVKPTVSGKLEFEDDFFDLITCFGTLHHTPNVSYIISELHRVTKPGGYILLREPIISMGDWEKPRKGLTRHERGIPLHIFRKLFNDLKLEVINEAPCFCMTPFLQRIWNKVSKRAIFKNNAYVQFDKWLSKLFIGNLHYHATKKLERIAPQSVFYVLKKS